MNRIYQVIWSSVKSCYVVVSENASRHGKKKAAHLAPSTTKRTMLAMSLGAAVLMGSGSATEAAATGEHATISGGDNGTASGKYSSISGGKDNVAAGENSSISGGSTNKASGINSSVSGGGDNEAIGEEASVSGGSQGKATGKRSSVTGGGQNQAAGDFSTVNGGTGNKAFGYGSSIIGGSGNVVGKMAVDENGNPKFKDSNGNDVVGTITMDKERNPILVDSKGNVIKDAHQYPDPSSPFAASVAVAIGGYSSSVQGSYSVGIAGGSTSASASSGLAAGRQATVTMANGVAIGYESTASVINSSRAADKEGRIVSFGHQAGDVYYTVDYQNHTVTENQYDSAAYNRLVNVADGIDDHDVVVMEQLKNAKAEAVAEAKTNIKVKGDEFNVHAAESTDAKGVQTTTISLMPKVTLKNSTDTTGAKQVVLDGTAGTISAGLSTDTKNFVSLDGTKGLAKVGGIQIGNQSFTYDYMKPVSLNDDGATLKLESTRASASGNFVTGLSNRTWTPGNYMTGRAATEDQLEQAGRHFLSIKTANKDDDGNPITPVAENSLANYYNDGATGSASMAFGVGTTAKGDHSLSMGVRSSASGLNSLAIGYDNTASGTQSVAVGNGTNASGNYSVAMGLGSQAGTQNTDPESTDNGAAVAVGFESSAEQTGSAAYGYMASANNFESSAFGTSATANADGSVALGAHSVANRDKGISGYLAPTSMTPDNAAIWISTDGAVSLGGKTKNAAGQDVTISRQITNLAAGSEDSDAVNVAQLKALASQGMNFQGNDTNTSVHLDQGGTLQIQGSGRKEDTEYSTQNVKVLTDTANKRLSIALDKNPTFDSVTAGTENSTSGGGQTGSLKIVGANSSSTNKATTITAGYAASPELSGAKGTGRISYTDGDGTAHTVATLGDGLKLAGDTGTGSVALDNTLTVSGGATNLANGNNIGVTANGSTLSLKLAKDITGLDTVTAGGVKMGTQSDGNDTTKSGKYVTGLDNTTWTVGQTQPVTGRAATEDQLKSVSDVVNTNRTNIANNTEAIAKGLNFSASNKVDGTYKTVKKNLGDTVAVRASDVKDGHTYNTDNLTTEIDDNGIITVKMDTQLTADKVTVGTGDNAITIDGFDGSMKTGSSTLNGTGLTINNGPSVTTSGISGGSKQITEVKSGASGMDDSNNPIYGTDTNAANIGDVKNIAAKTVTVSGDNKNTKVVGTPNTTDGTVDYKVSLNDTVTLGSDAGTQVSLNGKTGVIKAGNQATIDGSAGTASIGNLSLGTVAANTLTLKDKDGRDTPQKADAGTYATGLTNTTWDVANPSYVSGRAATEDELLTVSNTVNSGWKAQINGTDVKTVTPTDNTLNFVAGDNISLSSGNDIKDIKIATTPDVNFTTVRVGGTNTSGTYTGGIFLGNQAGGGANGSADSPIMSITGLKNTAWVKGNFMSGRAATEDQLNVVAQQIIGEVNAADIYVESGSVSYDTKGDGTGTLQRSNKTTGNLTGLHDYYVTGGSVSTDGKTLNLTKNGGDAIPGIDMTNVLNQDSHLVAADSGEYTVGSDGKVTLKVKNNVAGSTPTDVVISGIASNAALQKGLNFEANGAEKEGGSAAYNAPLGDKISVLGGAAKDKHTYNTDNITTTMNNGTITVKLDNDLTAHSLTAGSSTVDGRVRVTGAKGAYVEMDGSDGSIHLGNNGGRYSALYQNYGGTGFLTAETSPRLEYAVDNAPNTRHTIATLDDGMKFAGDDAKADSSKTVSTTLNSTLKITGGAAAGNLTDGNIGVVKNDAGDGLIIKLNKDLTNMGTISFAPTAGTTGSGIKIGSQTIANNGTSPNAAAGDYVTGLTNTKWSKDGIVSGRAATEDQLQQVANAIVNGKETGGGFGISDNAGNVVKQDLGGAIQLKAADSNLTTTADTTGKAITFGLSKELKDMTSATFKDATTGAMTVIDGKGIAITPQNGSTNGQVKLTTDGLSNGGKQITNVQSGLYDTAQNKPVDISTITADSSMLQNGATIGDLQTVRNGLKTELTNKGLDFKGNDATTTVHRNLGDTLTIQGTGADGREYDGGANVQVKADKNANTLTVQLDRDLNAHTLTLGKASNGTEKGEAGTLILNGKNKDNGMSPVSIGVTYRGNQNNEAMKTAMSRITYKGGNGNDHTVATLEDGLQLSGDNGEALNTTLDKKVTIKGGAKDKLVDNTTDPTKNNNIGVVASQDDDGNTTLSLQLAKDLTGLNTVTAGSVVMGNQNVISVGKASGQGNFITGLDNKTWDGTDYVSGRAATEDQLKTVSDSIKTSVNNAQFGITAGGLADGGDVTVKKNLGESIRIYGDAPVTNEKNDGSGDFWDRSKANILTKVKKDHDGNDYVSVELQDHLEVGVHGGADDKGTDGSMQFKGKSAKEVNITGDTGVILSDGDGQARTQTAALRQNNGTGYLDLAGSEGAFTSLFTKKGTQNLSQEDAKKSDTRLTYTTDKSSKTEHQVATLDDGLVIAGDNGQVTRLLNSTLKLSGGETDEAKLSSGKNIGVVANKDNDGLDIKLAKDLTDIDSINMTGGLKLNSTNGSSTITGLTNTSVDLPDFGKAGRAATEEQLEQVKGSITDTAKGGGFGLADDKGNAVKADLGSNIGIHGDSNITTAVSEDGKSLNIGLKKDVDLGDAGSIKAGGVTIDKNGIDAGGKNITNVKSGIVKGDDSDNGNAANIGDVKHIVDGKIGDVNGKIDNITKDVSNIKTDVSTIKQTKRTYQGDDGKVVNVDFGGALSLTGGATEVAEDKNIGVVKNGGNGLSLRLAKNLGGLESVTTGKTTMDDSGLTIAGSDGKASTTVTNSGIKIASSGDDTHAVEISNSNVSMGGQQIHDVAPGAADGDAVNVSQLKKSVGALGGAINQVDRRVDRVGAGAAALAALHPQDFDPDDKWDFAVGYGNYRGANAAAVGAFYKPNEDTTFSVGGTVGGGENMVNAGISFKFGQGNHVSNSRVAMAKEIKDLRKEVESLRSALVDVAAGKQLDPAKTKLFPDMPKNHWAYKEISELAGNGLLDGYPDGEFKGDRMMTRYEFATIVYRQMMAGRELSDRLVQEFEPELERIRIDVVARHKDGTPSIERVRVNKPADANRK
ncbi:ESPR-type extended signal peptide-containing protein [Mitsuokella multacida]|uniref:D-tyrosyl-tRNA(Tyr) deacylase n=1 Tax=Mitsuokella multacida DSM 20544 TaxID=500635 RepID=C9KQF1_9FIRM|nr:ESPR-type extended signal peptide-containing protein [Mitsuokella multacida]EEX67942.1 putative D-tyrosyl-tRNA(Tyr) deacylase [Mitsuokella multacida DSM 20544]